MGRRVLTALASLALVAACTAPTGGSRTAGSGGGLSENSDGTSRIVGYSRATPEAAMQDALNRAYAVARQRGQKLTPLKILPRAVDAPGGGAEYTCALTFRLERDPSAAELGAVDHSFASFDHRMRLLVEQRVLTIEEYSQLVAAHPGNPLTSEPRPASAPQQQ
jgi:hypothetical protein